MRRTNHRNLVNVGILSGRIPLISLVQFIAVAGDAANLLI